MENLITYAPIIVVVLAFLIQEKIFVTPEQLERKHREIIKDVERRFATIDSCEDLRSQLSEMKDKIDKIYDCLILQ